MTELFTLLFFMGLLLYVLVGVVVAGLAVRWDLTADDYENVAWTVILWPIAIVLGVAFLAGFVLHMLYLKASGKWDE